MEHILIYSVFILIGVVAGFIGGLLGVGGGTIIVPFLSLLLPFLGYPSEYVQHSAVAVSVSCMLIIAFTAMVTQMKSKLVQWKIVIFLGSGIGLGAFVGSTIGSMVHGSVLGMLFVVYAIFMAFKMLKPQLPAVETKSNSSPLNYPLVGVLGAGIGMFSSMLGIGGGTLIVPLLSRSIDISRAIAVSSTCTVPLAFFATLGYALAKVEDVLPFNLGLIYIPAAIGISLGSIIASYAGVIMGHKLDKNLIRKIFAGVLFGTASLMLYKVLRDLF